MSQPAVEEEEEVVVWWLTDDGGGGVVVWCRCLSMFCRVLFYVLDAGYLWLCDLLAVSCY